MVILITAFLMALLPADLLNSGTAKSEPGKECEQLNSSDESFRFRDIAWNGSRFVIVGLHGTTLTFPEGMNWVERASGKTEKFCGVAWGDDKYGAVANFFRHRGELDIAKRRALLI